MITNLSVSLARGDDRPLCEQLRSAIARDIRVGRIAAGKRLPSTRRVAQDLAVNRATVVEAYRRLEQDGLVRQRVGSGTWVLDPATAVRAASQARDEDTARRDFPPAPADAIDLASIAPDERGFPAEELGTSLQAVIADRGGEALGYGPVAGDQRLRELLAARLARRGLRVDESGLVLVGGAQQGLDLILRAVTAPGQLVVTEAPTYHVALDLLGFHGLEVASVPVVGHEAPGSCGLDFARLEALLERKPVAVYAMPTHQNPTGLSLDLESRRRLAVACARAGVLLIEDDYEADLRYEGEELPPVSALPEAGDTAYVGTLSKALFPGLRVGWVAARPGLLDRLARVKRLSDLSGSLLLQAAAAELIATGAYDRHLERVIACNRERLHVLREHLNRRLPPGCSVTTALGGHACWLRLPPGTTARAVTDLAAEAGVMVCPGDLFEVEPGEHQGLRLSVARASVQEIPRGVERLVGAIAAAAVPCDSDATRLEAPVRI